MKTIHLPQTESEFIHLECIRDDGSSYCIETRRCTMITVENCVRDVLFTPLDNTRHKLQMSRGWETPGGTDLNFRHKVEFVLA